MQSKQGGLEHEKLFHALRNCFDDETLALLERCGLLRFAQIMTRSCEKHLGLPPCSWITDAYFAVLGWDIQTFPVVGQLLQGSWEEPIAFAFEPLIGIVQNLILFMPFGFLLYAVADQPRTARILLFGFLLSLAIELCQLFFRLGWFEVDDILHNVLGTYLGICLYRRAVKRTST